MAIIIIIILTQIMKLKNKLNLIYSIVKVKKRILPQGKPKDKGLLKDNKQIIK